VCAGSRNSPLHATDGRPTGSKGSSPPQRVIASRDPKVSTGACWASLCTVRDSSKRAGLVASKTWPHALGNQSHARSTGPDRPPAWCRFTSADHRGGPDRRLHSLSTPRWPVAASPSRSLCRPQRPGRARYFDLGGDPLRRVRRGGESPHRRRALAHDRPGRSDHSHHDPCGSTRAKAIRPLDSSEHPVGGPDPSEPVPAADPVGGYGPRPDRHLRQTRLRDRLGDPSRATALHFCAKAGRFSMCTPRSVGAAPSLLSSTTSAAVPNPHSKLPTCGRSSARTCCPQASATVTPKPAHGPSGQMPRTRTSD
jgi:hypothetical protein